MDINSSGFFIEWHFMETPTNWYFFSQNGKYFLKNIPQIINS